MYQLCSVGVHDGSFRPNDNAVYPDGRSESAPTNHYSLWNAEGGVPYRALSTF
ncbi:hypothetical protein [uncultured Ruminococcus sp.]|uniref:hypothetical protein n=1 Tax=uncultured Ruminococcus sp. TaxID=165186 RepID=UPI0025EC57A2|nr:hypothetical protein [uncultured Ruminococcus sp.]